MSLLLRRILLLLVASTHCVGATSANAAQADMPAATVATAIDALIARLGADKYAERERASREIVEAGIAASDALVKAFNRKTPYFKFFLKRELIWVPFLGLAFWALDYPFMKRYSKAHLAKHPEDQGKDLEITQRACEKFQGLPVTVVNYLEGTRFTPAKHAQQQSPYRNLLKPKSGGIAFVIAALGKQMHTVLDVTIVYPGARPPGFWALVSGQVPHVIVDIHECELPEALLEGDYSGDRHYREHFQRWVSDLWQRKDQRIDQLSSESDQA